MRENKKKREKKREEKEKTKFERHFLDKEEGDLTFKRVSNLLISSEGSIRSF